VLPITINVLSLLIYNPSTSEVGPTIREMFDLIHPVMRFQNFIFSPPHGDS